MPLDSYKKFIATQQQPKSFDPTATFTQRVQGSPSAIRSVFARLKTLAATWFDKTKTEFIDLSIGQPHIAPHPEVIRRLKEDQTLNAPAKYNYPPTLGDPQTLEVLTKLCKNYYSAVDYKSDELMVTCGGTGGLFAVFAALLEKPADKILTFGPCFATYKGMAKHCGGTLEVINTPKPFKPTPEALRAALRANPSSKGFLLNNPRNPLGDALTRSELRALAEVFLEPEFSNKWIISDDVYHDFNNLEEHVSILDVAPELKNRCVMINSLSKGLYGAPSVRAGFVAAPKELIQACVHPQIASVSSASQEAQRAVFHAANVYLENPKNEWLLNAQQTYRDNLAAAAKAFKEAGFQLVAEPKGAFFLMIDASHLIGKRNPKNNATLNNDVDIMEYLIETAGVATVCGSGFEIQPELGCLRVSCTQPQEKLIMAAQRMGDAAKLLLHPLPKARL